MKELFFALLLFLALCLGAISFAVGGATKFGGTADVRDEFILKPSAAKYLLRVTSAVNDNDINIQLDWYEHSE